MSQQAVSPGPVPELQVVAALLWRRGALLVQQRRADGPQASLWEFPGGKVEPGEGRAAALRRECHEELGVAVRVGPPAISLRHAYPGRVVHLHLLHAHLEDPAARPRCRQARRLCWRRPEQLLELAFCAADVPALRQLAAGGLRPPAA